MAGSLERRLLQFRAGKSPAGNRLLKSELRSDRLTERGSVECLPVHFVGEDTQRTGSCSRTCVDSSSVATCCRTKYRGDPDDS